jgi:hypothetical protein
MNVEEAIASEVDLYVGYCRKAADHDEYEPLYRSIAHKLFYHIQEMRSTKKATMFGRLTR